ncbi:TPA: hypothetical protein ACH3X1_007927 [Trebouxia sp. C0004]
MKTVCRAAPYSHPWALTHGPLPACLLLESAAALPAVTDLLLLRLRPRSPPSMRQTDSAPLRLKCTAALPGHSQASCTRLAASATGVSLPLPAYDILSYSQGVACGRVRGSSLHRQRLLWSPR